MDFPLSEIIGRRRRFGFNSGKNQKRQRACIRRYECSVVLCARFESMCAFGGGKRRPQSRARFLQISNDSFRRVSYPLKSSINYQKKLTTTTLTFFFASSDNRTTISQSSRGFSHGPPTRVRDGWRSHRTSVRRDEILRLRRLVLAQTWTCSNASRYYAHFIWYFYHFELHSV